MKKEFKNIQTFEQYTDKNLNISDVSDSIYYIYDSENKNYYAGIPNTHDVFSKYKSEANTYKTKDKAQEHIDRIKDDILKKNLVVTM